MNELSEILSIGAMHLTPPKVASDGTQSSAARLVVGLQSVAGRADKLLEFVGTSCGEALAVRLTPMKEDGGKKVAAWEGRAFVGAASCKAPTGEETIPRVSFSLIVEPADDVSLLALLKCRLGMMEQGQAKAEVRLALEQRRLDFVGEDDEGAPAAPPELAAVE